MTMITGRGSGRGITVEVHPGGAMSALSLDARAMALGPAGLAEAVLRAVADATAEADRRTRAALRTALHGLGAAELAALGLGQETAEAAAEPRTWRVEP